ncbi:MAG: hypothetical protein KDD09_27365, partial [Phaeodactylibacter sp.]|nr:hypothetical protein [Phaeodactylibacter sp.]
MIQRIAHITLAFLLFISSAGLVINKHYCQNELKSIALFSEAEGCHQEKTMSCPMHAKKSEDNHKKGCCDDETEYVKSDEDQYIQSLEIELSVPPLLFADLPTTFILDAPSLDKQSIHYLNYKPPLIV